ncbi:MAG: tryptophan--tRNA ligase [Chloroflexota bacterium]
MKPSVFSGVQPSGSLTIGNYLGAIQYWVRDQDRFDNIFCVVDLHALTLPQDPEKLRSRTWETAALLLACGIDPDKSLLFAQSHVPEHTTLSWLLNTVTPMGWLNRMTQFKIKAGNERDSVGAGLYNYPVLMAADILAYHANFVPVGEDQKQHVELTRDIAERFNALYGDTFTVPEPMIPQVGARIMSLDDPSKKMSKSDPAGALFLLDPPEVIRKKVGRAVTDSIGVVRFTPEQSGLYNLLTMIQVLSSVSRAAIEDEFAGKGYKVVKDRLSELVIQTLQPLQERYQEFERDPRIVDDILRRGADTAHSIASPVVRKARERLGLRLPL